MHGRLGIHVCGTWIWMACTHATQGHGCVYNPPTHTRRLALVRFRSHAIKSISLQKAGAQALFRILSAFPSLPPSLPPFLHPPTHRPTPPCMHSCWFLLLSSLLAWLASTLPPSPQRRLRRSRPWRS